MDRTFQGLDILSPEDRHLFNTFSRGIHLQPPFSLFHKALEDIVHRQPDELAVEYDGNTLTYRQLDREANILASKLIQDGLQPRQIVCLLVQRSIHMVVAILAVLKCGCQYAPLDGGVVPETLLGHIVVNTRTQFVLCLEKFYSKVQRCSNGASIVVLDSPLESTSTISAERPTVEVVPSDGAYVIYTSGNFFFIIEFGGADLPRDNWSTQRGGCKSSECHESIVSFAGLVGHHEGHKSAPAIVSFI